MTSDYLEQRVNHADKLSERILPVLLKHHWVVKILFTRCFCYINSRFNNYIYFFNYTKVFIVTMNEDTHHLSVHQSRFSVIALSFVSFCSLIRLLARRVPYCLKPVFCPTFWEYSSCEMKDDLGQ